MKKLGIASLLSLGLAAGVPAAHAAHIDFLDSDDFGLAVTNLGGFQSSGLQSNVAGTPGFDRTVTIQSVGSGTVSFDLNSAGVTDNLTQGANYDGPTGSLGIVTLAYTGFVADFLNITNGAGMDTGNDWTRIDALFEFAQAGQVTVNAELGDVDGTTSTVVFGPQVAAAAGPITANLDYATFEAAATGGSAAGLDLTMIDSFTLTLAVPSFTTAATAPISFALTDIRRAGFEAAPVPVPATLFMLLIGLGGVVIRRKVA